MAGRWRETPLSPFVSRGQGYGPARSEPLGSEGQPSRVPSYLLAAGHRIAPLLWTSAVRQSFEQLPGSSDGHTEVGAAELGKDRRVDCDYSTVQ